MTYSESFAWHEAARWRGLSDEQMAALEGNDQARIIACWDTAMQIAAVLERDRERRIRRAQRQKP